MTCFVRRAVPVEVLVKMLEWLEPYDLCSVAQTCLVPPPSCSSAAHRT
jgi:hypothetical protein